MLPSVTTSRRIIVVLYCFTLAYCFLWVPWRAPTRQPNSYLREGYGWVWAGPRFKSSIPKGGDFFDQIAEEYARPRLDDSMPDYPRILLRVLGATAIFTALFFATDLARPAIVR
jgi:hypothetical protein